MKSKKQMKNRTRKYKKNKTLKGGKLDYKHGKWVAHVNQRAIQNDNVRMYRESEARMMNLLKIPNNRPLTNILTDIPYMIAMFNAVDYYKQRRIISNLITAIERRELMNYADKGHQDFLRILTDLLPVLTGIFDALPAPAAEEEPDWLDELHDKITNLEEEVDFLQREIEKFNEEEEHQLYMVKQSSIEHQLKTSEEVERHDIEQQFHQNKVEFEKLISLYADYKDKLIKNKQQLEATKKELADIQTQGKLSPSESIKSSLNAYSALVGPPSPVKMIKTPPSSPVKEFKPKPKANVSKKKEKGNDFEAALLEAALADATLETKQLSEKSKAEEMLDMPRNKFVRKLSSKLESRSKNRNYVRFLSKESYDICQGILQYPEDKENLKILYDMSTLSGRILSDEDAKMYKELQHDVFYSVIFWFIYSHIQSNGLPFDIENIYWLLYLINDFNNVIPSCQISDIQLTKYQNDPLKRKEFDTYLNHIYKALHIYSSYFSKNMLQLIPSGKLTISFASYKYIFETFNALFKYLTKGQIVLLKPVLEKCIRNISSYTPQFEPSIFPTIESPIYLFDDRLSIVQTPPLFHDEMNTLQKIESDQLTELKARYESHPSDDIYGAICSERNVILNRYIDSLLEKSTRELNELQDRNIIMFIKKILLIFYDLMFTSSPINGLNYIFDVSGSPHVEPFILSMKGVLHKLIPMMKSKDKDAILIFNQLYAFLSIYFPPMEETMDDTFIETSEYIFKNNL